jgi:hypothetical protein
LSLRPAVVPNPDGSPITLLRQSPLHALSHL